MNDTGPYIPAPRGLISNELPRTAIAAWLRMADAADEHGVLEANRVELAEITESGRTTVDRDVDALEQAGLLHVEKRVAGNQWGKTRYVLALPNRESCTAQ